MQRAATLKAHIYTLSINREIRAFITGTNYAKI